ncbi:hypothetical protein Hanom_Chr16g01463551 [Helianthus anomalus]
MGLFTEEDSGEEENTGGFRELPTNMRQIAWAQIADGAYDPSVTKSSQLRDPLYRYIHRVLSNSLSQRCDSTGVVNLRDLTVLYCIHNRVPLDVPYLFLRNMHLNQLASSPTHIFFKGWIYRLFITCVHRMPKSIRKGPWSGKVDLTQCLSMGIIYETGDGTVRFQTTQGHFWNQKDALVLHANPSLPPPQYQGHQTGSSSQGGGFPDFQSLHDLLHENLLFTCNTYNMASNTFTRVGAIERNISTMQDDITYIREHMVYQGGDDEDEDMD